MQINTITSEASRPLPRGQESLPAEAPSAGAELSGVGRTRYARSVDVIICDIDGTIVDVNRRMERCLLDIGVEPGSAPSVTADGLKPPLRSRFFDLFLSEKYAGLDEPIPTMIEQIGKLREESGLPLVFLTGRPSGMRKSTRKVVETTGLPFYEIILRSRTERFKKTTEFKVGAVRSRGFTPKIVVDDDAEILAAFAAQYPDASYYLVRGPQATPWND